MFKIIILSTTFILIVLGINHSWSFGGLRINPSMGQKLVENLRDIQSTLPRKVTEGAKGAVKGVQTEVEGYFLRKTGGEIVDLLESLPAKQQEEIKKEYCGD